MNIFDNIAANLSLKYENSEFYKNKLIKRYKPLITPYKVTGGAYHFS